jgi:endonuclease/exonuclease/phosphatase family metal-dependent hydrolase
MEIAARQPEAVGLQEVTHYIFDTVAGVQNLDYIDVLQLYLTAMGAHYDVAVRQNNVTLVIPVGAAGINSVTYTDGDAILVRHDIPWSNAAHGHYPTQAELNVGGVTFDNLRGWNAVTLHVNGQDIRFVNTHMEIQAFRAVQEQQARELAAMLEDEPLPTVLVGDFNSAANPSAPAEAKTESYHTLRNAGFADLELRDAHSNDIVTCCHLADLSDVVPTFDQRLDLVLARWGKAGFGGQSDIEIVIGQRFPDHDYFLWPSDHAAVFGKIWPAPGLANN